MRRLTVVIDTPRMAAACSTVTAAVPAVVGASWSLVAALRVGAYVRLTRAGFATLDDLREAIGFWELMR